MRHEPLQPLCDSIYDRVALRIETDSARATSSERDARNTLDPVSQLTRLLDGDTVDLAGVCDEIRAQLYLEALAIGLTSSLSLSAETSATTLEEAAVVLGTDRLRVLAYMWSIRPGDCRAASLEVSVKIKASAREDSEANSFSVSAGATPETLYLASFLRWLGLDSRDPTTSGNKAPCFAAGLPRSEFAGLRNTMMRDFLALIPVLYPPEPLAPKPMAPQRPLTGPP